MASRQDSPRHVTWLSNNVVWLATLALFFFVIVKSLRVSDLDIYTTYALLSSIGMVNATFGVTAAITPLILLVAAQAASLIYNSPPSTPGDSDSVKRATACILALSALTISAFATPAFTSIMILIVIVVTVLSERAARLLVKRFPLKQGRESAAIHRILHDEIDVSALQARLDGLKERPESLLDSKEELAEFEEAVARERRKIDEANLLLDTSYRRISQLNTLTILLPVAALLASLVAWPLFSRAMWLPIEEIQYEGADPAVGYVVNDGADWYSILLESDRRIIRLRSESIVSRTICTLPEYRPVRSLMDMVTGEEPTERYPQCSNEESERPLNG